MKCKINYNNDGTIDSVNNEQGERSVLFDNLVGITNDKQTALDIFALTEGEEFKAIKKAKEVAIRNKNKQILSEQVQSFADSIGAVKSNKSGYYEYSNGDSTYSFKSVGDKVIGDGLLETKPEARGKGSARALFSDFLQKAGASGFTVVDTIAARDSSTKDSKLKTFYKSLGFVNNGTDFEIIRKPQKSDKKEVRNGRQNTDFFEGKAKKASSNIPYLPVLNVNQNTPVAKAYKIYTAGGNFTGHISKMIPGFQEKQKQVAEAIVKGKFKSFLDIGTSEGGMIKTVASQNKDVTTVGIDPNIEMKKNFNSTPEVKNAEFKLEAFQGSWTEKDGTQIKEFISDSKFEVVNEDFAFQFINNDRATQVKGVKELMTSDGIFITSEKFHTFNESQNENKKYDHQKKYFSPDQLTEDKQTIVSGMSDDMVNDLEYFNILKKNFKYVIEFWNAGNFKGYLASDNKVVISTFLENVGDLTSEFTDTKSLTSDTSFSNNLYNTETKKLDLIKIPVEPTVEEALSYATKDENTLSEEDHAEMQNTVLGMGMTSYGEMIQVVEDKLINDKGVIIFTEDNLVRSGMFNNYEIGSILGSVDIQRSIRRMYQGLKNSENRIFEKVDEMFVVKTGDINTFGKQEILNPYLVEQEVNEIIAGQDVEIVLDNLPYASIKQNYKSNSEFKQKLDNFAANHRKVANKVIQFGEVVDETSLTKLREQFEKTLNMDDVVNLTTIINYLDGISENVWNTSKDAIYEVVKDFNKRAVNSGIDFQTLEDSVYTKPKGDIMELLLNYSEFINSPKEDNLDYFFDVYTYFFKIEETPITSIAATQNENNVKVNDSTSEYDLFNEYDLVKEKNDIYTPIEKIKDVEEAYAILFENKDKIPNIQSIEALKEYVRGIAQSFDTKSFEANSEELENFIIHKIFFGSSFNNNRPSEMQSRNKASLFNGDYNYITKVFTSKFYVDMLKEKRKFSDMFKNFYSNFEISNKGITLKNSDPITLANIQPYISEDLYMYNLLSKNLNIPVYEQSDKIDLDEMQFKREFAISNPESVEKLKSDFMIVSPITIAVKNETRPIIKTFDGLYEIDYNSGNVTFYNKLPEGNENFNSYGQHKVKTDSDVDLRTYQVADIKPEKFFQAKNFYTKSELEKINKEHFKC